MKWSKCGGMWGEVEEGVKEYSAPEESPKSAPEESPKSAIFFWSA